MKSVKGSRDCRKRLVQSWQEIKPQEQSDRKSDVDDDELKWHEKLTSVWSPCCPEVSVSMCGSSAGQRSSAGASHESHTKQWCSGSGRHNQRWSEWTLPDLCQYACCVSLGVTSFIGPPLQTRGPHIHIADFPFLVIPSSWQSSASSYMFFLFLLLFTFNSVIPAVLM